MPYDLYGRHYASRVDAENAELAQCAAIDADILYRKQEESEREMYRNSKIEQNNYAMLSQYVQSLEERIAFLESITNHLKPI